MWTLSPLGRLENDVDGKLLLEDPYMDIIPEFSDSKYDLLDSIDFEDTFNGVVLPDLEMEMVAPLADMLVPELYASGAENNSNNNLSSAATNDDNGGDGNGGLMLALDSSSGRGSGGTAARKKAHKQKKSSSKNNRSKNSPHQDGKRKVKVDWTPELHKRFVEAVEKLGVDKAVPSRILEVMGTRSLTRHNIASHLQKYHSQQKHLLAREAEAASWNQRRRMYAAPHLGSMMRDATALAPWVAAPAVSFPSVSPPQHHYRSLHMWGHPTMNRPVIRLWPNPDHVANPPPLPMPWAASPLPPHPLNPSYWAHPQQPQATIAPTLPARFFAQPAGESTAGFVPPPPVPGVLPPTMFEADHRTGAAPLPPEFHPSKGTIDMAIEEVLSNRKLPLPLGLKPPSMDGVIGELQRQGLTKILPSSSSSSLVADNHQSLASTTIA